MKRSQLIGAALIAAGLFMPGVAKAQLGPVTNRLTFSARFGLNISARFSGVNPVAIPAPSRTTPDGGVYNYDNGYVLPDVSGSGDGYTWYWGYDDSGSQVDAGANTILLSRSSGAATLSAPGMGDDPSLGAELAYTHHLGTAGDFRYGFEAAVNYLSIGMRARSSYSLRASTVTDAFPYVAGTTPPGATNGSPYQGSFGGPGFVIGTTPVDSTITMDTVGLVTGSRELDAGLWGARLGPYLEFYLDDDVSVTVSGGFAVGLLDNSVSWNETIAFTGGGTRSDVGRGSDQEFLWGGYLAANLYWRLSEKWTAAVGAQYQNLGTYEHTFATRRVELDLSNSIFFTVGLGYNF
jgi:hypothetical protein